MKFKRHFMQKYITLSNEGYGFGFLVSPGKGRGTVVQSLIPNGVAWKVSALYILHINFYSMQLLYYYHYGFCTMTIMVRYVLYIQTFIAR